MLTALLLLSALPWLLILLYQISHRGFLVLLIWLLIAPIATNLLGRLDPSRPFQSSRTHQKFDWTTDFYYNSPATITLQKLLEPTRTLILSFIVVSLTDILLKKKRPVPLDRTEVWMSIFSVVLLTNVLFQSSRLGFGLHTAIDAFIIPFLTYYLVRRFVTSEDRFHQLTGVIKYMGFSVIVIGLIERLTRLDLYYRLQGPFDSTNVLYVVVAVVFFTALLDSVLSNRHYDEKQTFPRCVRWFVLYLAPVIILFDLTRGDWLGFLLAMWLFLFLGRRLISFSRKAYAIGLVLIFVAVILVGLHLLMPEEFFEQRVANPANALGRLVTWELTIEHGLKAPIFGIGLNDLRGVLDEGMVRFGNVRSYNTPHNSLLSMFAELGAVGLFAYLGIVASIIQMGLSLYRTGTRFQDWWRGATVLVIMVAYLVPSLFGNTLYLTGLSHIYVYVFMGTVAGLYGQRPPVKALYVSYQHVRRISTDTAAITR